jgi:hypothetical protein
MPHSNEQTNPFEGFEKMLQVLVRTKKMTTADWAQLIEAEAMLINPLLDRVPLRTIGDECFLRKFENTLRDSINAEHVPLKNFFTYELKNPYKISLKTQALLFPVSIDERSGPAMHSKMQRFWGLSRNGDFLYIEIHFVPKMESFLYEEIPKSVTLKPCTPETLLGACQFVNPQECHSRLIKKCQDFLEIKRQQLNDIQRVEGKLWLASTLLTHLDSSSLT